MSLNPLEQLNWLTIGAVIAVWLATFALLRRLLFLPLLRVMAERRRTLDAAAQLERESQALLERARAEASRISADAAEQARRLEQAVKDELSRTRQQRLLEATTQAQALAARGRDELRALETAESKRLEAQLLGFARQALLQVVERVDDQALAALVQRVLAGPEAGGPR